MNAGTGVSGISVCGVELVDITLEGMELGVEPPVLFRCSKRQEPSKSASMANADILSHWTFF